MARSMIDTSSKVARNPGQSLGLEKDQGTFYFLNNVECPLILPRRGGIWSSDRSECRFTGLNVNLPIDDTPRYQSAFGRPRLQSYLGLPARVSVQGTPLASGDPIVAVRLCIRQTSEGFENSEASVN
jgi:hypothetical protein